MCSHYQATIDPELYRRHFGVELPEGAEQQGKNDEEAEPELQQPAAQIGRRGVVGTNRMRENGKEKEESTHRHDQHRIRMKDRRAPSRR